MRRFLPAIIIMTLISLTGCQYYPKGTFQVKEFTSENLCKSPRKVEVYLPKGYNSMKNQRYSVLYMYDCQNIFHDSLSFTGISWGVAETVQKLMDSCAIEPIIVVGIDNAGELRANEYSPKKVVQRTREIDPNYFDGKGAYLNNDSLLYSDDFLKFIVEELKPYIDKTYKTLPDREHTAVMGSSLGGLMALYAYLEYPNVFGKAGCVSTHWPISYGDNSCSGVEAYAQIIKERWDTIQHPVKIYFDYGTETIDAGYINKQPVIDKLFRSLGYPSEDYFSKCFINKDHSERSWRERLDIPMVFLFGK